MKNKPHKNRILKNNKGFTIVELLIATLIFSTLISMSLVIFSQILTNQRRINFQRILQEETRDLTERIVKEFRNGAIDYPAYYIENIELTTYADYLALFPDHTNDFSNKQNKLFILDNQGKNRTTFWIESKQMKYTKESFNGTDWDPAEGFDENNDLAPDTLTISPDSLQINDFQVHIYPHLDPYYFYNNPEIQSQPIITIILETEYITTIPGQNPTTSIQTSISTRSYGQPILWN